MNRDNSELTMAYWTSSIEDVPTYIYTCVDAAKHISKLFLKGLKPNNPFQSLQKL